MPKAQPGSVPAALANVSAGCVCFHLRKTARTITQLYDHILAPSGLRGTQFTLLRLIGRAGGLPFSTLAEVLGMDRTTLTRNLGPLTRRKLVRTEPGADRRVRLVSLTPRGRQKLMEAEPLWAKAHGRVADALGAETWSRLQQDLSRTIAVGVAAAAEH